MSRQHQVAELEQQGWEALSQDAQAAIAFYSEILVEDAVMLFPGGLVLRGRREILDSMNGPPWESFEMRDQDIIAFSDNCQAVVYQVTAHREDSDAYEALVSSIYVLDHGRWKLALHQHSRI